MTYKFTIRGTLPGLNELIEAERRNRYAGAALKKQSESVVMHAARSLGKMRFTEPVYMVYHWYEPNRRRDKDNISSFGRKVIQDALVKSKILQNDGWNNIIGFEDRFEVDKKNPRIVVEILEDS
jgi:Holliday junction resolvase RusA-like endonuclease